MSKFLMMNLIAASFLINTHLAHAKVIKTKPDVSLKEKKSEKITQKKEIKPQKVTLNFDTKKTQKKKDKKYWSMICPKGYISGNKVFCAYDKKRPLTQAHSKVKPTKSVASRQHSSIRK